MIRGKRKKRHIGKRILAGLLSFGLCLPLCQGTAGFLGMPKNVEAKTAEKQPITYEYYTRTLGNTVPASWLFVGTYLMSAKAVTAQIYQAALDSRNYYKQPIAFYTSELDNGEWKNVEGAGSLTTILPVSGDVEEETLFPYLITVVVGDDGIPRDPEGNEIIDIFTPFSLYEMENLPEMEKLLEYYESDTLDPEEGGSSAYLYSVLFDFFENDNNEDFNRDQLNVSAAIEEYSDLSADGQRLEDVWDEARTTSSHVYPEEYKDIMQVMRNWSNIRDNVTDRADREEVLLNALFNELQEQKLSEEADAALYVSRQVDATRRAEIYYNLLENDNLTGSYAGDASEAREEIRIRRGEVEAELAGLAVEADRAEYVLTVSENAIKELEKENDDLRKEADEVRAKWNDKIAPLEKRGGQDGAAVLAYMKEHLVKMEEEFSPVRDAYTRLDSELEAAANEAVELDDEQKQIQEAIDQLDADTDAKIASYRAAIEELRNRVNDLKSSAAEGKLRTGEYQNALQKRLSLGEKIATLSQTITKETEEKQKLMQEDEGVVSSRLSAAFDSSKTYDPEKKKRLQADIEEKNKVIDSLTQLSESAKAQHKANEDVISELAGLMDLEDEIAQAGEAAKEGIPGYEDMIILAENERTEQKEKLASDLAALSDPYQEKLKNLQKKNDAYVNYLPLYQEELEKVNAYKAEIASFEAELAGYEDTIASLAASVSANDLAISQKQAELPLWQAPVDALNAQADVYVREREVLDRLEQDLSDNHLASALAARLKMWEQKYLTESAVLTAENEKQEEIEKTIEKLNGQADLNKAEWENTKKENAAWEATVPKQRKDALYDAYYGADGLVTALDAKIAGRKEELSNGEWIPKEDPDYRPAQEEKGKLVSVIYGSYRPVILDAICSIRSYREKKESAWCFYYPSYKERCDRQIAQIFDEQLLPAAEELFGTEVPRDEDRIEIMLREYMDTQWIRLKEVEEQIRKMEEDYIARERLLKQQKHDLEAAIDAMEEERSRAEETYQDDLSALSERLEQERASRAKREEEMKQIWINSLGAADQAREQSAAQAQVVSDQTAVLEEVAEHVASMQSLVGNVDHFGMAPTLVFLQTAAKSGRTMHGRVYENMSDYRKAGKFVSDEELENLIASAVSLCDSSRKYYEKIAMQRGSTAADYTGFILSRQVARHASVQSEAMPYLQMIVDLLHIEQTETVHEERELSLIYGWLLPFSMRSFAKDKSEEALDDYEYYIRMASDRDSVQNALAFVTGRLEYAYSLRSEFAAEGDAALARLEAHIVWLENLLRALRQKAGLDSDEDEKTKEEEYLEEKQQAIDEGNLVRARMIDELLKGLINSGDASETAGGGNGKESTPPDPTEVDPKNRPTAQTAIREVILEDIEEEGYDIEPDLDKYRGAGGNVGELAKALEHKGVGPENKNVIKNAVAQEKEGTGETGTAATLDPTDPENRKNHTGGTGNLPNGGVTGGVGGDATGNTASNAVPDRAQAERAVSSITNGPLTDLPDDEQAALLVALTEADPSEGDELDRYAKELLEELLGDANPMIYRQYLADSSQEYVSLGAMDKNRQKTRFRAVKMGAANETTLAMIAGGSASYTFTVGSKDVKKNDLGDDVLKTEAAEQTDKYIRNNSDEKYMYLSEEDARRYTGCSCVYIYGTDWAILVTPGMEKEIAEDADILQALAQE